MWGWYGSPGDWWIFPLVMPLVMITVMLVMAFIFRGFFGQVRGPVGIGTTVTTTMRSTSSSTGWRRVRLMTRSTRPSASCCWAEVSWKEALRNG